MTVTPMQISNTLVEIQAYLLARPGLALTAQDIGRRSGRSLVLTRAVLDVLADAGVLDKSSDGAYSRRLPRTITQQSHRIGRATRGPVRTAAAKHVHEL